MSEGRLKNEVAEKMRSDFEVFPEVTGFVNYRKEFWDFFRIERAKVRADFLLSPKPHLIETGFPSGLIAVEVKYFQRSGIIRQYCQALKQASDYAISSFELRYSRNNMPLFALLASNLQEIRADLPPKILSQCQAIRRFIAWQRVGQLLLRPTGWEILFQSECFFLAQAGEYSRGKADVSLFVGNAQKQKAAFPQTIRAGEPQRDYQLSLV